MSASQLQTNSRLLIVDDNRAIHEDFKKVLGRKETANDDFNKAEASLFGESASPEDLRHAGFQLDSAFQGKEGLDLVSQAMDKGAPYAMAFMDVRMPPGWDGVETTAKIWEVDPDLQVVICTAFSDCSWDDMLQKLGRSDRLVILKKPFDQIEVIQLANSLTKKWQLLQEAKLQRDELEKMVAIRTMQMVQEQEKLKAIFENSPEGIFQRAPDGRVISANPALAAIYGYASARELMEKLNNNPGLFYVERHQGTELRKRIEEEGVVRQFESEIKCKDGTTKWISQTACKVLGPDGSLRYHQGFVVDITAQKKAQEERNRMEIHLRQSQKLESVGQLAAGIAHEINTPIQYIGDNIRFLGESVADLMTMLTEEQKLATATQTNSATTELRASVEALRAKTDVNYLKAEIPNAIQQSLDGVDRVSRIVSAMKEFSHPGNKEKANVDLNHAVQTTLTVARNELKYVANVVTEFDASLPPVPCLPGEVNQVILNLLVNAVHAIRDVVKEQEGAKGTLRITTKLAEPWAEIRISDTGTGIPEDVRRHIFEPFFTTKEVGQGTGQGLAISHSTIVNRHGGQLTFETEVGKGTTFIVRLPLVASSDDVR